MSIKDSRGWSLIEMMLVLLIFGIMATLMSYSYSRYVNNDSLRTAARQLATDINTMKGVAVTQMNTAVTISFNKTANSYTLSSYPLSATVTRPAETKSLSTIYAGQGIIIQSLPGGGTTTTLTFLTRGLLSPSPTATTNCDATTTYTCWFVLQNSRGSQATVTYNVEGKTYVTFAMQ
ncbi:MAG TPA: prepilin-type N-terminal cleavage/methylation domain-containing protein [Smithella sp.]|nr:prepilin-type N-terminal cleavage/methylation domain-containing protein [Smithella sp.]